MFYRLAAFLCAAVILVGCSSSKFQTYNGPQVTRVVVFKEQRMMHLFHHNQVLSSYEFELGFAPSGDKSIEGDGRTPEGAYFIDRRNPNSDFHLSIGISYPNEFDIARAELLGLPPGGDIFIHGTPKRFSRNDDWTWGCIAVTNKEIEEIYAMVQDGTPIDIFP